MSNVDRSASGRTKQLRGRVLSAYSISNPPSKEGGSSILSSGVYTERLSAQIQFNVTPITNFICSDPVNLSPESTYYPTYAFFYDLSWSFVPGNIYTLESSFGTDLAVFTGPSAARVYCTNEDFFNERIFTLRSETKGGNFSATATGPSNGCFLAGAKVTMADGTQKPIEQVLVGESVLGAFGEINTVLALHRPFLGPHLMIKINETHDTTNLHPHISLDKQFYCGNPELLLNTFYGKQTVVIDGSNNHVYKTMHGLKKERIKQLQTGVELKTVQGSRVVEKLETYTLPPTTQVYHLVISGSHTYHVNDYAVTGWANENDFNYDTWTQCGM